jgi:multimeric flavodoxin WrbA
MKILGINGSPRRKKSQTRKLVDAVLDGARQRGAETELVDIAALDILYCLGCWVCYGEGECVHADDLSDLWEKMTRADGIVLGSPVYFNAISAQLKTMIDRLANAVHCQLLVGKYGCAVTTAGGLGSTSEVLGYINYFLNAMGVLTVGGVGATVGTNAAPDSAITEARNLGETLADAIQTKRHYADQENAISERGKFFRQLIKANKEDWRYQYEFWMEKGWM